MHWNDKKEALRAGWKRSQCSPMNVIRFLPLIYWVVNVLTVMFDTASDGKGEQAGCAGDREARIEGCLRNLIRPWKDLGERTVGDAVPPWQSEPKLELS